MQEKDTLFFFLWSVDAIWSFFQFCFVAWKASLEQKYPHSWCCSIHRKMSQFPTCSKIWNNSSSELKEALFEQVCVVLCCVVVLCVCLFSILVGQSNSTFLFFSFVFWCILFFFSLQQRTCGATNKRHWFWSMWCIFSGACCEWTGQLSLFFFCFPFLFAQTRQKRKHKKSKKNEKGIAFIVGSFPVNWTRDWWK